MYNFYVFSDLHLEKKSFNTDLITEQEYNESTINICILAGDIGNPQQESFWTFIDQVCKIFDLVLFVAGNHEYFHSCIELTNSLLKSRETDKFKVLDKDGIYFPKIDTLILGCTLWSYIPKNAVWNVVKNISNYKAISNFTIEKNNSLFVDHLKFIETHLKQSTAKTKIVITHHAPLIKPCIKSMYLNSLSLHSYATNIPDIVKLANYWIHGHTHYSLNTIHENCHVVSNQFGYIDNPNFNPKFKLNF
jgi:hypothetical protein